MRKILCLSCFLFSPAMAHSPDFFDGGGVLMFISSLSGLILFFLIYFLILIFSVIYLSICKDHKEKENAWAFAFYKTNIILLTIVAISVVFILPIILYLTETGEVVGAGVREMFCAIWLISLGLIPYYFFFSIIYGIIQAFTRTEKNSQ